MTARFDVDDVIQCAAGLVDKDDDVHDEYRRGVIELAAAICLGDPGDDALQVMGYAVYGVNRRRMPVDLFGGQPPVMAGSGGSVACPDFPCDFAVPFNPGDDWRETRINLLHHIVRFHPDMFLRG